MSPNETIYAGEVQLAGWSDTHTGGAKITLWLPSSDDLDKFRALTVKKGGVAGHRMMCALVEVGDDEKPVPPPEPTKASEPQPKAKNGPLCIEAIDLCRNPTFQRWVAQEVVDEASEANAKEFILSQCDITSRKELDVDHEAAALFVNYVRVPFMHWQREVSNND